MNHGLVTEKLGLAQSQADFNKAWTNIHGPYCLTIYFFLVHYSLSQETTWAHSFLCCFLAFRILFMECYRRCVVAFSCPNKRIHNIGRMYVGSPNKGYKNFSLMFTVDKACNSLYQKYIKEIKLWITCFYL